MNDCLSMSLPGHLDPVFQKKNGTMKVWSTMIVGYLLIASISGAIGAFLAWALGASLLARSGVYVVLGCSSYLVTAFAVAKGASKPTNAN